MRIGILTGSGTYALPGLEVLEAHEVVTAYGQALVTQGWLGGVEILHVSRHGEGHRLVSHQVEHRANVAALRDRGADAILAVTVCGGVDPVLELGQLVVFDDLHFPANRLPGGELCTFHTQPGAAGRGHWVYERPFSEHLRGALLAAGRALGYVARDGGCYGHVDGPRFNTRSEIRMLAQARVTAVSQTAGPETVLAGEAGIPYALLGFVTDYANGVKDEATPVETLLRLMGDSTERFAATLTGALSLIDPGALEPAGTTLSWD